MMNSRRKLIALVLCVLLVAMLIAGCGQNKAGAPAAGAAPQQEIRIAQQFGLIYAPLLIAKEKQIFEKYGLKVTWSEYGSGAALREALVANDVDVAFMGIPPFLIGWDKGLPAKIAIGFNTVPNALVTYHPEIKSLKDFKPQHKIGIPAPGSNQHIFLAMAAEKELGDPQALDNNLVALPHPDGAAVLLAQKDIDAHFTTPPYLFEELSRPGYHVVVSDTEALGQAYNLNVGVVTEAYRKTNPAGYASFIAAVSEATTRVNENKDETAEILAPQFNLSVEKTKEYLNWPGMNFTTAPYGLMSFADFMQRAGYISKTPRKLSDIAWENVCAIVGQQAGEPSPLERMQYRQ